MSKPITHIVRSKDAGGFNHFTHGHLSAIIITVEPVEIPTKRGPVIGYRPATEAKRPARQAVS
jgi:hypothetical protein